MKQIWKILIYPNLQKNRVYCIVRYLSIVCSLKGTGLPSGYDISLTDTFFLPSCDTFGRGQHCVCVCVFLASGYEMGTVMHEIPISSPPS
jgi:hypothetical protein